MMALTMMLVALMVCLTLGIGMKAREKAETQTLADAAAYSGAVATARTFNSIALLNRAAVAEMVSMLATQSLLSYASYYRATVYAARDYYLFKKNAECAVGDVAPCNWCTRWTGLYNQAVAEIGRMNGSWTGSDQDSNSRIVSLQGSAGTIHGAQTSLYTTLQGLVINTPGLANAIAQRVDQAGSWQGELSAPPTVNAVNMRELGDAAGSSCDPAAPEAICTAGAPAEVALKATMGTRWFPLEKHARNLTSTMEDSFLTHSNSLLARGSGDDFRVNLYEGSTRFVNALLEHGPPGTVGLMSEAMEGKLLLTVQSAGCGPVVSAPISVYSYIYTTSIDNGNDRHYYAWDLPGGGLDSVTLTEGPGNHQLGGCTPPQNPCGLWPGYVDLNPGHVDPNRKWTDLYGQPKVTAVIQRDYATRGPRADPWNLLYNINIRRNDTETFDNNGMVTAQGLDISRQTAIATGLAYYHRMGHWREPPNFFNPYWRATLVSGAIDTDGNPMAGGTDQQTAVGGAPFASDVITQLSQQGFHGWQ